MRKGFTIIELLVASLLLGMLVTILTMVFNQSSIAWRTGIAGTVNLDIVRENIAEVREEADNSFVCDDQLYRMVGLWKKNATSPTDFRGRACDADGVNDSKVDKSDLLRAYMTKIKKGELTTIQVGSGKAEDTPNTYVVNVMSAGPDGELDTWDDVWSSPDDFD